MCVGVTVQLNEFLYNYWVQQSEAEARMSVPGVSVVTQLASLSLLRSALGTIVFIAGAHCLKNDNDEYSTPRGKARNIETSGVQYERRKVVSEIQMSFVLVGCLQLVLSFTQHRAGCLSRFA